MYIFEARWQNCEKRILALSCLSVRPQETTRPSLDGFSWNFIFEYLKKNVEKIQVELKSDNNNGQFTWRQYTFFIISRSILLKMRKISEKSGVENHTHILCSITFFRKSCREWNDVEKYCIAGLATDDNMGTAFWITKATDRHAEYVILIAFPL
jgi:hypothetical protein